MGIPDHAAGLRELQAATDRVVRSKSLQEPGLGNTRRLANSLGFAVAALMSATNAASAHLTQRAIADDNFAAARDTMTLNEGPLSAALAGFNGTRQTIDRTLSKIPEGDPTRQVTYNPARAHLQNLTLALEETTATLRNARPAPPAELAEVIRLLGQTAGDISDLTKAVQDKVGADYSGRPPQGWGDTWVHHSRTIHGYLTEAVPPLHMVYRNCTLSADRLEEAA